MFLVRAARRFGTRAVIGIITFNLISCGIADRFMFYGKEAGPAPVASTGGNCEEIWVHSRDGVTLNGMIIHGNPGLPLVLYFPGIDGNDNSCSDTIRVLNRIGLTVCIFDYRGYGKSHGEVVGEKDLYEDGRSVLSYLQERGWRQEEMVYFGQSLGAAVAIQMGLEGKPAGLVLESPFTSMEDMGEHLVPVLFSIFGRWSVGSKLDNLKKIRSVEVPLLVVVGEKDELTPVSMSLRLYERASGPKRLHLVKGGSHCDAARRDATAFSMVFVDFLRTL